jgi:hypothetical protein
MKIFVDKIIEDANIEKRNTDDNLYREKKPNCIEKVFNEERTQTLIDIFATLLCKLLM